MPSCLTCASADEAASDRRLWVTVRHGVARPAVTIEPVRRGAVTKQAARVRHCAWRRALTGRWWSGSNPPLHPCRIGEGEASTNGSDNPTYGLRDIVPELSFLSLAAHLLIETEAAKLARRPRHWLGLGATANGRYIGKRATIVSQAWKKLKPKAGYRNLPVNTQGSHVYLMHKGHTYRGAILAVRCWLKRS
ncbi:hypothetical protein IF1G_02648 [Cordyceps javanica]|uniref:Uncharacterized protein n=1 Tax=Cordyceps javanica TaxID=43265 RepID=A0A545VA15_9HYPO|nr:hypothetical protein IF1G_02648 [Cordyceps javanica]